MVIYDSPGYDKSLNKEWIYDILKKIKEKVTKFKLEFRIQRNWNKEFSRKFGWYSYSFSTILFFWLEWIWFWKFENTYSV